MTRDELFKLAVSLDCDEVDGRLLYDEQPVTNLVLRLADAVAASEREACAKVCEEVGARIHGAGRDDSEAFDCADAIRARGEK